MGRKRKKPDYLSEREFNCIEIYLKCGNKTQAGIEAGYKKSTAAQQAGRVINGPKGRKYLAERMKDMDNEKIATADEIMEYLTSVMRGEVKDQFDMDVSIQERTRAANELAKRLIDTKTQPDAKINIICDIPMPKAEQGAKNK